MISLVVCFFHQRFKALTFFGKAPIEELDHIEAQRMHDAAHDSHREIDRVANEQDQDAQEHARGVTPKYDPVRTP